MYVRLVLKTNTYGKQKRGCDFGALDVCCLKNKNAEKKKAEAILDFASFFIKELCKMMKISWIFGETPKVK